MINFAKFLSDDAGAVTVDWVTLTGGILLVGTVAIYAIFNSGGTRSLVSETNTTLSGGETTVTVGPMPTFADAGTDGGTDGSTDGGSDGGSGGGGGFGL